MGSPGFLSFLPHGAIRLARKPRLCDTPAVLLFVLHALAAAPDALFDDSVILAISGECPVAEAGLRRRVDAQAADLGARLALDLCRYTGTQRTTAREDLASLYVVGAPYDPAILVKRRGDHAADAARLLKEARLVGAAVVRAMVAAKSFEEAQEALPRFDVLLGSCGPLAAARLLIESAQNGATGAWPAASRTLDRFPEDADVLEEIGRMAFLDAPHAPPAVVDAVMARGRTTARLNVLLGLLKAGQAAECVDRQARGSVAAADRPAWDALAYRCAAAAGNLARADELLAKPADRDARARAQHAELLIAAGRTPEAESLLAPLLPAEPLAVQVALTLYAKTGRAADVEALARKLPADSVARLTAATALVQSRRYAEALLLVEGTCATQAGANGPVCERIVSAARRGLGR